MSDRTKLKNRSVRRKANRFRWATTMICEPNDKMTLSGAEITNMLVEFSKLIRKDKKVKVKNYMEDYQPYPKNKS